MGQLVKLLQDKRWRFSFIFLGIALIIWFGGPYVAIAGHSFLANPNTRFLVVLALAALGASYSWRLNTHKSKTSTEEPMASTSLLPVISFDKEVLQFNKDFNQLLQHLAASNTSSGWLKASISSYLLMADEKNDTTAFCSALNNTPAATFKAKYLHAWTTEHTVLIDFQTHALASEKLTEANLLTIWEQLFQLWKNKSRKLHCSGIIIAINIATYLTKGLSNNLRQQLELAELFFKRIPVFIVFTDCDLIAGFTEFFADLSLEERKQTFGFTFPANAKLNEIFPQHYSQLVQHLNQQLLPRLHKEHHPQKRGHIKDFLLQLEYLQEPLSKMLQELNSMAALSIRGCYFVSTSQQQVPLNFLNKPIEIALQCKLSSESYLPKLQNKNYFTQNLLAQFEHITLSHKPSFQFTNKNTSFYLATGLLLIFISSYWTVNYIDSVKTLNALQNAIQLAEKNQNNQPYAALPILTTLNNNLHSLNTPPRWWSYAKLQQANQVKQAAIQTYQEILLTRFLPDLKRNVENQLINPQDPVNLYSALKVYLMLADRQHRDNDFISQWFTRNWQKQFPKDTKIQKQLTVQLNILLQQNFAINANQPYVKSARATLSQIPLSNLAFSILADKYSKNITLIRNNDYLSLKNNYAIPELFTAANINKIYNEDIPQACHEVISGNWVLGEKIATQSSAEALQLVNQVQTLYLNRYANAWQQLLANLEFSPPNDLEQTVALLNSLDDIHSSLWQLLNSININTADNNAIAAFNLAVSPRFQALNSFTQSPALLNLQNSMSDLQHYLQKITQASNVDQAAFQFAVKRMENDGMEDPLANAFQQWQNLPAPLSTWLAPLPQQSWHQILTDARFYINHVWQSEVLTEYNNKLDGKYPLFKDSDKDINLADFTHFFGPEGNLENFFQVYLKPFVNMHNVYWVWKDVDNDHIAIPQTTLEMFIRAALIQKMFYINNTHKPFVEFTLVPTALEPGVTAFKLNLEGQNINFQTNQAPQTMNLVWPGPAANKVTLEFIDNQGRATTIEKIGTWAWFRLLDRANLQTTLNNPRQFRIIFDLNGNSAQYELLSNDIVNPFIPGIINVFRAPATL